MGEGGRGGMAQEERKMYPAGGIFSRGLGFACGNGLCVLSPAEGPSYPFVAEQTGRDSVLIVRNR